MSDVGRATNSMAASGGTTAIGLRTTSAAAGMARPDLATRRTEIARLRNTQPSTDAIGRLRYIAETYKLADQQPDASLMRQCQLVAMKYVRYAARNGYNLQEVKDTLKTLHIFVPSHASQFQTAVYRAGTVANNPLITVNKIWANLSQPAHNAAFANAQVTITPGTRPIAAGLRIDQLDITVRAEGEDPVSLSGEIYHVTARDGFWAGFEVIDLREISLAEMDYTLVTAANYLDNESRPTSLSISGGDAGGDPANLYLNPDMDGLVILRNGRIQVHSLKETSTDQALSLVESAWQESDTSVFQSHLVVHGGANQVADNGSAGRSGRRCLATFNDGSMGIISIGENITLYEFGEILEKIPGMVEAVNLDTGSCMNVGGYQDADGKFQPFSAGSPRFANAPVFYVDVF